MAYIYNVNLHQMIGGAFNGNKLQAVCGASNPSVAMNKALPVIQGAYFGGFRGVLRVEVVELYEKNRFGSKTRIRVYSERDWHLEDEGIRAGAYVAMPGENASVPSPVTEAL